MEFKPLGDAREHYWLTIKMGTPLGLSLVDAWADGRLTPEGYAEMIHKCRGCEAPCACARLLEGRPDLDDAPEVLREPGCVGGVGCGCRDVMCMIRKTWFA